VGARPRAGGVRPRCGCVGGGGWGGGGGGGGGGGSASGGDFGVPPTVELAAFLQEVLQTFQDGEMESQGKDPLRGHATRRLGAFLIASSRAST